MNSLVLELLTDSELRTAGALEKAMAAQESENIPWLN